MDTPLTILSHWEEPTLLLASMWWDSMYFLPGEDKPIWILVDSTFKGRLMIAPSKEAIMKLWVGMMMVSILVSLTQAEQLCEAW